MLSYNGVDYGVVNAIQELGAEVVPLLKQIVEELQATNQLLNERRECATEGCGEAVDGFVCSLCRADPERRGYRK